MNHKSWNRRRHYNRIERTQTPRKKFFIYTEGSTEAVYFSHYRQLPAPYVHPIDKSDSKRSLVEKVVEDVRIQIANRRFEVDDKGNYIDEAWVALDRDIAPGNPSDHAKYNEALQLAKNNGIQIAYSNDCFELWYLLHFQEVSGSMDRAVVIEKLSRHLGRTYTKGSSSNYIFETIKADRAAAIKRAAAMYKRAQLGGPPEQVNPSSTVHILVERIMAEPGFRDS